MNIMEEIFEIRSCIEILQLISKLAQLISIVLRYTGHRVC